MPALLIRTDYLLSEAFELIGRRLFGLEWTGDEYAHHPVASPDEERQFREPVEKELREIATKLNSISNRIADTISKSAIACLVEEKQKLERRQGKLNWEFHHHPPNDEASVQRYAPYFRKITAENTLIEALRTGALMSHNGRKLPTHPAVWEIKPGFGYCIELSMAVIPRSASPPRRREPVRIEQECFDKWLPTVKPLTESAIGLLPERDRAARLLIVLLREHGSDCTWKRLQYQEAVSRAEKISGRAFDYLWRQYAPPSLKKAGARKKPR